MTLVRVVAVLVILVAALALVRVSYVVGASDGAGQQVTQRVARDITLVLATAAVTTATFALFLLGMIFLAIMLHWPFG